VFKKEDEKDRSAKVAVPNLSGGASISAQPRDVGGFSNFCVCRVDRRHRISPIRCVIFTGLFEQPLLLHILSVTHQGVKLLLKLLHKVRLPIHSIL